MGGIKNINNQIIKMMTTDQIKILTIHMQKMWNKHIFPDSWKQIKAITFPKPNKDTDNLNNYRIISLLNPFHKVFNKRMKKHNNEHIRIKI